MVWSISPLVMQVSYCAPFLLCSTLKRYFSLSSVPFDEDEREPSVWFLDHNYLENMTAMFRKVNGRSIAV